MDNRHYLDVNGSPITAAIGRETVWNALKLTEMRASSLRWVMPAQQKIAIMNLAVTCAVIGPMPDDIPKALMTFCGVDVLVDDKMPADRMELRVGDATLVTIKNLAPLPLS